MMGGDVLGIFVIVKDLEHQRGEFLRIIMVEEETGLAILDEVGHLIAVAANAGKAKCESLDKDKTISLEIAWHTEYITNIVILGFLVERYLAYKVIAIYWIVYWVLLGTDDI